MRDTKSIKCYKELEDYDFIYRIYNYDMTSTFDFN